MKTQIFFILFIPLVACNTKTTNGKTLVVDVRSEMEWKQGHGTGINIPLSELENHKSDLLKYDSVIFVCEKGARAQNALTYMNSQKEHTTVFKNGISWTNFAH
jgi:rhodanese-related sulfurtransferase